MNRVVKRGDVSEEDRPAACNITARYGGPKRWDTHRRGRAQESGTLWWILSSETKHVSVLGSST